jgi:hypothetical protein
VAADLVRGIAKFVFTWIAVLVVVAIAGVLLYYIFASDKQKLSDTSGVSESQIILDPKPHGCDFDDAPLGNKHCHCEKVVTPEKDSSGKVTAVYVYWNKV